MAGVIIDGIQWERCNRCSRYTRVETLRYEQPSPKFKYGRDLCQGCYDGSISEDEAATLREIEVDKIREYRQSPEYQEFLENLRINPPKFVDHT